jgi:threonine dehydrogenase-like Zn-dependent dehydrogenase
VKALQFQAIGQVNLVEMAAPEVGADELLVKTEAATICTSDLKDIRENPFGIELPVVLGHEGAGTVAAVGSGVTGFRVGDRVAAHPVHPCGRCANCRLGWGHLCTAMEHFGLNRPGTFAEYFSVRADRARVVSEGVPFAVAALAEPVCVCLEALAQANLPAGGTLLVLGDGPFGVLMARLAASMSLDKCVLAGRHDFRLDKARDAVRVNVRLAADGLARLRAEAGSQGYDAVILAVGSADALRDGLALLRARGRMVVFAGITGSTPVDMFDVHVRELEIVGACNDEDRFDEAVQYLGKAPDLEDLITHTFHLTAYQAALAQAASRHDETLKVAFVFDEEAG